MAIREGVWDCSYCGTKGISGPATACTACGAARDASVKLYLPENATEVTDAAALAAAKGGADWHCSYCGTDNKAAHKECGRCGASVDGTEQRRGAGPMVAAQPAPGAAVASVAAAPAVRPARAGAPARSRRPLIATVGLVTVAAAAALYFFVLRTHGVTVEVTGHRWQRQIAVEKLEPVAEECWEGEMPANGRLLSSREEIFSREKVQTGTERVKTGSKDLGNGYFEDLFEDRPVFSEREVRKRKLRYEIERWVGERTAQTQGRDLQPEWPAVSLGAREREGARRQTLAVLLRSSEGEELEWEVADEERWRGFREGAKHAARVRTTGGLAEVGGPAP